MAPASTTLLRPLLTSALFFLLLLSSASTTLLRPQCRTQSILYSGETLKAGEGLLEGPYFFKIQADCNLVLYDFDVPQWASNSWGPGARNCHLTLQSDGNLVVLTPQGRRVWASNSARGQGNYVLILQKDRNVVIYGSSIWTTNIKLPILNRNGVMMSAVIVNALDNAQCPQSILYSGETLKADERLLEGHYQLIMQQDCNLVLYYYGTAKWHSNTAGKGARNCSLTLQSNGNLMVLTPQGSLLWTSFTGPGLGNYVLILRKDGNVALYGSSTWATNTNLPTLNRNGVMMSAVIVNALDETNNGTTKLIKTVV